jgi:hypothetical protein
MTRKLLIAHAPDEEGFAEIIAEPLRKDGYDIVHMGTLFIGDLLIEEVNKVLEEGAAVIFCGTTKAVGSKWARSLVVAARSFQGVRVFPLHMEADAYVESLTWGTEYGKYWQDPVGTVKRLRASLQEYYPIDDVSFSDIALNVAINRYYDELRKRYKRLDLESLTPRQKMEYIDIQLRSVYVEQSVRDDPPPVEFPKEIIERLKRTKALEDDDLPPNIPLEEVKRVSDVYYRKPPRPVLNVLTDIINQHVVILGDPGSGKSTLTRYILLSMIDVQETKINKAFPKYLPLLIELKNYVALLKDNSQCKNFLDYFEHMRQSEGYYLGKKELEEFLNNTGNAIVIFDGLDEIFDPAERDKIARHIDNFKTSYSKARIIVTSRIVGFRRQVLVNAGFRIYTLQDLDEIQIREFAEKWYSIALLDNSDKSNDRTEAIMQAVKDSPSIRQLAGNPLLLTIMAILGRNQELPRERWKLYEHAASVLIEIWDVNKYLSINNVSVGYIDEDDKKEMLRRLAYNMQGGKAGVAGNYIDGNELENEFQTYIVERYEEPKKEAKMIAQKMIQQLHERNFILSLYGAHLYGFVHRAFLEYFCALSFVHDFQNSRKISLDDLLKKVFGEHFDDQSWHEVLRLIAGMIEPQFSGQIISYLSVSVGEKDNITIEANAKGGDDIEYGVRGLSLALKCLAEIKKIFLLAEPAELLLRAICKAFDWDMKYGVLLFSFFKKHILPTVKSLTGSWPGNKVLAEILRWRESGNYEYIYDQLFGSFIGYIGNGSKEVHDEVLVYSTHSQPERRVLAPFALATGWPDDPLTFPLICKMAEDDPHPTVCYAAIYALGEHYNHIPQTFEILKRNAVDGRSNFARAIAITCLANHFSQEQDIYRLICTSATNESDKYPRTAAVKSLGEFFNNREETYRLLCEVAVNDPTPEETDEEFADPRYVRDAAIDAIFTHWPDHHKTLEVLKERSQHDKTAWLRKKATTMYKQLSKMT